MLTPTRTQTLSWEALEGANLPKSWWRCTSYQMQASFQAMKEIIGEF